MANYRQIHTQIWNDDWFSALSNDEKLLFVYLFSNDHSTLTGLYKLSMRVLLFETGMEKEFVQTALDKFELAQKVFYRDGIIWVVHMWRYHANASPLVQKRVQNDLALIPDCPIKRWCIHYIDTGELRYDDGINTTTIPPRISILNNLNKEEEAKVSIPTPSVSPPYNSNGSEAVANRVYCSVTGQMIIPSSKRNDALPVLIRYVENHGSEEAAATELKPYYLEWTNRGYVKSNISWLTDWAASGSIPPRKGKEKDHPEGYRFFRGEWRDPRNIPTEEA